MKWKSNLLLTILLFGLSEILLAQVSRLSNISTAATNEYIGWNGSGLATSKDLDIENNYSSQNINLSTFDGSLIKRMTILNTGEVGIGIFPPSWKLDVDGDVNINDINSGFKIGPGLSLSKYVLWHNGNTSNIFVGVNAGNTNLINGNTFVGAGTGGNSGTTGIGDGSNNTFVGYLSGFANDEGNANSFFGSGSGALNEDGHENTFLGYRSGQNHVTGNYNIFIGSEAQPNSIDITNSVALGWLTQANANNMFILVDIPRNLTTSFRSKVTT
jgi:hypothetical protein